MPVASLLGSLEAANGMVLFGVTTAMVFGVIQKLMETAVINLKG